MFSKVIINIFRIQVVCVYKYNFYWILYRSRNPSDLQIRAGTTYRDNGGIVHHIDTIETHPLFDEKTIDYDAAVITIRNQFKFSNTIQPIEMATSKTLPVNEEGRVSGWGRTKVCHLLLYNYNNTNMKF